MQGSGHPLEIRPSHRTFFFIYFSYLFFVCFHKNPFGVHNKIMLHIKNQDGGHIITSRTPIPELTGDEISVLHNLTLPLQVHKLLESSAVHHKKLEGYFHSK